MGLDDIIAKACVVDRAGEAKLEYLLLTANFVIASSPKASMKRVVGLALEWAFVELNVDASLDHDLLRGTMGAVLRDNKGKLIVGGMRRHTTAWTS